MFAVKRLATFSFKRKITNYQFIQRCSIYQYHHKSTTYIIHQNRSQLLSCNRYNRYYRKPILYHHTKYSFTVTPLEKDGTLSLLQYGDKQIYLLGTAHISTKSADQVRQVIRDVKPDTVFVELCPTRAEKMWAKIRENQNKEHKDLAPITGEEWLDELPYAKQMRDMNQRMLKFLEGYGFVYGGEFMAALEEAEKINATLVYGDRDVKETMKKMNDAWAILWNDMTSSFSSQWKDAWKDAWDNARGQWKQATKAIDEGTKKSISDATKWYKKSADGKTQSFGTKHKDDSSGNNSWESWFFGDQSKVGEDQNQGNQSNNKYAKYENMSFWEAAQKGWEDSQKQRENMRNKYKKAPHTNWKELIGLFTNPEETIESMKDRDKIRDKFKQMEEFAPDLVNGLVHERDKIMTDNLKKCDGKVIVAVVGIGHMDGMESYFKNV